MDKFTIFTIILAVSVITITADLAARDYFAKQSKSSVISAPEDMEETKTEKPATIKDFEPEDMLPIKEVEESIVSEEHFDSSPLFVSAITERTMKQAGFSGVLKEEQFNGKVFQLLDITKIPVTAINFYKILEDASSVASVAEIALPDEIRALQMYVLLQNKTKTYIDLSLNETNAYGDRSFYINHSKKPDEAFLAVKIGKTIYAFAYVKTYHPQIKKLLQLLYG